MLARYAVRNSGRFWSAAIAVVILAAVAPALFAAKPKPKEKKPKKTPPPAESVAKTECLAKPAESLAGELVRQRPEQDRKDEHDLLNQVDLAKHVVYTTAESPVPEAEQFQFIDGVLRTPEKGDARLCLPVEVPRIYRLSIVALRTQGAKDPAIGIGFLIDGRQVFAEFKSRKLNLGRFYGRELPGRLISRPSPPGPPPLLDGAEVLVGEYGIMLHQLSAFLEWLGPNSAWSLDERWRVPATDQIFLTFPAGQYDVRSVTLEPLTQEQWVEQTTRLVPGGLIAWTNAHAEKGKVSADVNPLTNLDGLHTNIQLLALQGDFDELERWGDRLRREGMVGKKFASEFYYEMTSTAYLPSAVGGSQGALENYFQAQLGFVDEWLKQKPDSVAARIVKARSYMAYAWDARGGEFAGEVPEAAWKPFQERLEIAQTTLDEAARLKPPDVCVFSTMLTLGKSLDWDREKMERTFERGLQITKKDYYMINSMVGSLLPRWGGKPGDLGKFALQVCERLKGDDGLDAFARVARTAQVEEVSLMQQLGKEASPDAYRNFTDPAVVLEEFSEAKLRAMIPVVRKRHSKTPQAMNHICWICCVLDDRATAKELFGVIGDKPDLAIWGSQENFDHWREWSDPAGGK